HAHMTLLAAVEVERHGHPDLRLLSGLLAFCLKGRASGLAAAPLDAVGPRPPRRRDAPRTVASSAQRTETENFVDPFPPDPSQLKVTWQTPESWNSIVPRYRPGVLSGDTEAPTIIDAIPGIAMLVLSVTLPMSTGCLSLAEMNSMANAFLP